MHRCSCSTKALDIFIRDIAGLHVRQQRAKQFFLHHRQGQIIRSFGSGFLRRQQIEQVKIPGKDGYDDYVPLVEGDEHRKTLKVDVQAASGQDGRIAEEEGENLTDDGKSAEDWHADIEVVTPGTVLAVKPKEEQTGSETNTDPSAGITVDRATLAADGTATTMLAEEFLADEAYPEQSSPAEASPSILKTTAPTLNARQLRKQRRLEAGTFRPNAQKTQEDEGGVMGVLEKIKKMEGPPIPTALPPKKPREMSMKDKKNKPELAGKASEKPTKAAKEVDQKPPAYFKEREPWQIQKKALNEKFGEAGWQPRKRLSPDTLEGIRALHASDPDTYATPILAEHFKVTPDAIRRILKSKWRPNEGEVEERRLRWEKRGEKKRAEIGEQGARKRAGKEGRRYEGGEDGMRSGRRDERSEFVPFEDAEDVVIVDGLGERIL